MSEASHQTTVRAHRKTSSPVNSMFSFCVVCTREFDALGITCDFLMRIIVSKCEETSCHVAVVYQISGTGLEANSRAVWRGSILLWVHIDSVCIEAYECVPHAAVSESSPIEDNVMTGAIHITRPMPEFLLLGSSAGMNDCPNCNKVSACSICSMY